MGIGEYPVGLIIIRIDRDQRKSLADAFADRDHSSVIFFKITFQHCLRQKLVMLTLIFIQFFERFDGFLDKPV